jgi:hypothetical protein
MAWVAQRTKHVSGIDARWCKRQTLNEDVAFYRRHTARHVPPSEPVAELVVIAGRGAGKTRQMTSVALCRAIGFDPSLIAPGNRRCPAAREGPTAGTCSDEAFKSHCQHPVVARHVYQTYKDRIELWSGITIVVATASHGVRGFAVVSCIADELAFWADETGEPCVGGARRPASWPRPRAGIVAARHQQSLPRQ